MNQPRIRVGHKLSEDHKRVLRACRAFLKNPGHPDVLQALAEELMNYELSSRLKYIAARAIKK